MAFQIGLSERNAATNGLTGLFNQGANPSVSNITIYSNATTQPATPETAIPSGSVTLAIVPFSSTAFATATTGTGVANGLPLQTSVINSGTAGWFAFYTGASSGVRLGQGSITINGGGGDMTFDNVNFVSGGTVSISSLSISTPM